MKLCWPTLLIILKSDFTNIVYKWCKLRILLCIHDAFFPLPQCSISYWRIKCTLGWNVNGIVHFTSHSTQPAKVTKQWYKSIAVSQFSFFLLRTVYSLNGYFKIFLPTALAMNKTYPCDNLPSPYTAAGLRIALPSANNWKYELLKEDKDFCFSILSSIPGAF